MRSLLPSNEYLSANKGSVLLVTTERFAEHEPPAGHPEGPERANVMIRVASQWANEGGLVASPKLVQREVLQRVHTKRHIDRITATEGRLVQLDPDTYTSAHSATTARLAAGAAAQGVDHVIDHGGKVVAFVRPPGHHAERDRAMGFCLFNNAAVAGAHALTRGADKVAIIDYDVHHGNGTQWIFYEEPRVLYISLHQYPFYPGTGSVKDIGNGPGKGFTVNVPLEAGAGDEDYDLVFEQAVVPILGKFMPDICILSAGFDAHERDPLGGMQVSTDGYSRMTKAISDMAELCCDGRMVVVIEGGYHLKALEDCLSSTLGVMSGRVCPPPIRYTGSMRRGHAALDQLRLTQARLWPIL